MDSEERGCGKDEARQSPSGGTARPPSPAAGAWLGLAAALPCAFWLWGFTVDDAFIPARVAAHLLQGIGPRFNPGGPVTDAVTPLGFAHWIAALAWLSPGEATVLDVLAVARVSGFVVWLATAALLGADLVRAADGRRRELFLGGAALASCVPLAAWAGGGLETPWVTLCCTWAMRPRPGAHLAAGVAAAWRPELLPWALASTLVRAGFAGQGTKHRNTARRWLPALAGSLGPAVAVAVARSVWFDRPTPLSLLAKTPDLDHGLSYCLGVLALSGPWWLLASRGTWRAARERPSTSGALAAALTVHLGALVLAGGDWMPFFRLAVPVLPSVILLGVEAAVRAPRSSRVPWAWTLRLGLTLTASLFLLLSRGEDARRVMERRQELVAAGRPLLSGRTVATVDVGWVAVASGANVVDLAGVTDPRIAALPGGHTTKRVSGAMLVERDVEALVLLAQVERARSDWPWARFRYGVDARLAPAAFDLGFRLAGRIPLPGTDWEYLVCTLPQPQRRAQALSR